MSFLKLVVWDYKPDWRCLKENKIGAKKCLLSTSKVKSTKIRPQYQAKGPHSGSCLEVSLD